MASTIFNGTSRFTNDFSAAIERSVGIASLRLTQMQQQRVRSADELSALQSLETRIAALQDTIKGVTDSVGATSWQIAVSDAAALRVSASDGVAAGNYSVKVLSLGCYSTAVGKSAGRTVSHMNSGTPPRWHSARKGYLSTVPPRYDCVPRRTRARLRQSTTSRW